MGDCSTGSWFDQFGCVLIAPQTAADLVVTVVSAGLAAAVAVVVLRSQFRHDRALAAKQEWTERALARAASQRPYIEQLGNGLIDLAASGGVGAGANDKGEVGIAVLNNRQSDELVAFREKWSRSEQHLEMLDARAVWELWGELSTIWAICHEASRSVLLGEKADVEKRVAIAIGMAATQVLSEPEERAARVGAALLGWDGTSELDIASFLAVRDQGSPGPGEAALDSPGRIKTRFLHLLEAALPVGALSHGVDVRIRRELGQS